MRPFTAVLLAGAISALTSQIALADATLDRINAKQEIKVGVILSGGPFGAINPETQEAVGLNAEMAQDIAKQLGVKASLVSVLPANRVQFLQQGKVDILIANMEWNPERDKILGHVPTPFYKIGGAAIVAPGQEISRWEDLKGKPVCLSQGSNYIKPLTELGVELKAFKASAESLLALHGGNCVAAVHDSTLVKPLVANNPDWKDYSLLGPDLIPSPSVIWTRKGQTDTQAKLDAIVKQWHSSGWLLAAEKRNNIEPLSAEQLGIK